MSFLTTAFVIFVLLGWGMMLAAKDIAKSPTTHKVAGNVAWHIIKNMLKYDVIDAGTERGRASFGVPSSYLVGSSITSFRIQSMAGRGDRVRIRPVSLIVRHGGHAHHFSRRLRMHNCSFMLYREVFSQRPSRYTLHV